MSGNFSKNLLRENHYRRFLGKRGKDGWRKREERKEKERRRENKRKNLLPNFQFKL
jgi:hypothetical protein